MRQRRRASIALALLWTLKLTACAQETRVTPNRWGKDYFPNLPLVTQDGKTVRFYDDLIRGKMVLIDFIYTGCPDMCPLTTARLVQVEKKLGGKVGRDLFFYSISVDPANDSPEQLSKFARAFHTGPGWLFLTGKPDDEVAPRPNGARPASTWATASTLCSSRPASNTGMTSPSSPT